MEAISLAIIGCGAVTELFHIPAALCSEKVKLSHIYDVNLEKAHDLAEKYNIPNYGADFQEGIRDFKAAIIATPNVFHKEITINLLNANKHVLVEKPMALNSNDCREMVKIAKKNGLVLTIGQVRRFYPANQFIKNAIECKLFGELIQIDISEGYIFNWPMATGSFIDKKIVGGGVLYDVGIHVIDLLHWWLGELNVLEYNDDSVIGMESDCNFTMETTGGKLINAELSRQRVLSNEINIVFERAKVKTSHEIGSEIRILFNMEPSYELKSYIAGNNCIDINTAFKWQLDVFSDAIKGFRTPYILPEEGIKSLLTIENCMNLRRGITYEWEKF